MDIIDRKIRGLVHRRLLPKYVQRVIWNREYATGRWDSRCLHTPNDPIYELLAKYCADRDICDIGSGQGNTITEMLPNYRTYTGMDVSDIALSIAAKRAADAGRERVAFVQGFMHTFTPTKKPDVFLFRESLQYVSRRRSRMAINMAIFLRRYAAMLAPDGIMIGRLCISTPSEERYAAEVETVVRQNFEVIESRRTHEPPSLLLVFQPSH
jgi:2-polyprenyl-3-methyl-5-hydroxy-6-metoxy-1,4-benzoquinol methylase